MTKPIIKYKFNAGKDTASFPKTQSSAIPQSATADAVVSVEVVNAGEKPSSPKTVINKPMDEYLTRVRQARSHVTEEMVRSLYHADQSEQGRIQSRFYLLSFLKDIIITTRELSYGHAGWEIPQALYNLDRLLQEDPNGDAIIFSSMNLVNDQMCRDVSIMFNNMNQFAEWRVDDLTTVRVAFNQATGYVGIWRLLYEEGTVCFPAGEVASGLLVVEDWGSIIGAPAPLRLRQLFEFDGLTTDGEGNPRIFDNPHMITTEFTHAQFYH